MTCDNCSRLTRELREAREEIAEWGKRRERESPYVRDARGSFASREESPCYATPRAADMAKAFRLTVTESRALDALFDHDRPLSKTEIMNAMDSAGDTSTSIVRTVICNVRKKIGVRDAIAPVKYFGYQITESGRDLIRNALNGS